MADLSALRHEAMKALRPPAKIDLAEWVEANIVLPSSIAAQPGRMRLWPHQVDIARSMAEAERTVVLKSARIGFSQLAVAVLGHYAVNDPSPCLVVLPAEQDCRDLMVNSIEPVFAESPALRSALTANLNDRDTLYSRRFPGGSLALVSARAPRNLRARTARVAVLDELDAWEVDVRGEGDPVELAIHRTATFGNRRIIMGSSPVHESTSRILRAYEKSDQRIYECPCPHCGERHEVRWKDIHWQPDQPETGHWACPSCGGVVEEAEKAAFVSAGRWRATCPEVVGCHGYRISALISLLPTVTWPRLVAEFLEARKSPETLQTFVNTVLGEAWRDEGEEIDESTLASRAEAFDLENIPPDVLLLTAGIDTQDDRLEVTFVGWSRDQAFVLGHELVFGSPLDDATWREADDLLRRTFKHPSGGTLKVDAAIVDSGDGGHTDAVYAFCKPRAGRRIMAGKGMADFSRPLTQLSQARHVRLILVGVDSAKSQIMNRLQAGRSIRFSHTLDANWFEQLASERRIVRYARGQPYRAFERIPGRRAEALDCLVYAFAARQLIGLDLDRRAAELADKPKPPTMPSVIRSAWLGRQI